MIQQRKQNNPNWEKETIQFELKSIQNKNNPNFPVYN